MRANRSSSGGASRAEQSYLRRRAGVACSVCRARKTKCDNARPACGFCVATGGECLYPDQMNDTWKLDRGSLAILQRISELETSLTGLLQSSLSLRAGPGTPSQHSGVSLYMSSPTPVSATPPVLSPLGPEGEDRPPPTRVVYEAAEMTFEKMLGWPVVSSGEYPPLVSTLASQSLPFVMGPTDDEGLDVSPTTVTRLVDNFLATNHIKNPIFDVEGLWGDVRSFLEHREQCSERACLILLICAVSVLSPPWERESQPGFSKKSERLALADHYFQASQRQIGLLYHTTSLLSVQCSFLTAVYLMSTLRILAAWKSFSQAGSQILGWLAACRGEPDSRHIAESLYWSCLKSELELRTELGLPGSSLNEMSYPHLYPTPPSPMDKECQVPDSQKKALEAGWFFYLAEIALRRIMNDALSSRYQPSSWYYATRWWTETDEKSFVEYVDEFTHKLGVWHQALPPSMSYSSDPTQPTGDILRGILRCHVIDIFEVLYFPAIRALTVEPQETLGPYTRQLARKALENDVYRLQISEEGFWHRHQGTWLMLRTCSRSSLHLLAAALRAKKDSGLADVMPYGWQDCVRRWLSVIAYWEDESPDLTHMRVRLAQLLDLATT